MKGYLRQSHLSQDLKPLKEKVPAMGRGERNQGGEQVQRPEALSISLKKIDEQLPKSRTRK